MPTSDFGELVWENGHILIKGGQFSQASLTPNMDSFINSKTGRAGTSLGLGDADVIPWFYHLNTMLHHEATSGFLAEASGVISNCFPSHTNISATHNLSNPVPYSGSRVSSVAGNDALKYAVESASLGDQLPGMRLQKKKDKQVQTANFTLYRQVGRAKNDLEIVGARVDDRLVCHEATAANYGMLEETNGQKADTTRKCLLNEPVEKQANVALGEDCQNVNQVNCTNAHMESNDAKKTREPTAAPHSLCSENSGLRASNNPTYHLKRKHSNEEDCESSSEDAEGESISVRKAGCKRNRAAEMHNFTERKRREKINDKFRALQELVPNCTKVDKVTMLDEAIEYLRVLQYQVQMMSIRSQMFPSPIMPQPGLEHLQAQQFMPMGFGMGMGYQAGILNTSPGFPTQTVCFPGPSNPPPQLWNAAQGIPMSMPAWPGLSIPMLGTHHTQLPRPAADDPNLKDSHVA